MRTIEEVIAEIDRRVAQIRASINYSAYASHCEALEELRGFILSGDDPFPWGPAPSAEEVTAHAARPGCLMGLWLCRCKDESAPTLDGPEIVLLWINTINGKVQQSPGPITPPDSFEYRPIDNNGALVPRPTTTEKQP